MSRSKKRRCNSDDSASSSEQNELVDSPVVEFCRPIISLGFLQSTLDRMNGHFIASERMFRTYNMMCNYFSLDAIDREIVFKTLSLDTYVSSSYKVLSLSKGFPVTTCSLRNIKELDWIQSTPRSLSRISSVEQSQQKVPGKFQPSDFFVSKTSIEAEAKIIVCLQLKGVLLSVEFLETLRLILSYPYYNFTSLTIDGLSESTNRDDIESLFSILALSSVSTLRFNNIGVPGDVFFTNLLHSVAIESWKCLKVFEIDNISFPTQMSKSNYAALFEPQCFPFVKKMLAMTRVGHVKNAKIDCSNKPGTAPQYSCFLSLYQLKLTNVKGLSNMEVIKLLDLFWAKFVFIDKLTINDCLINCRNADCSKLAAIKTDKGPLSDSEVFIQYQNKYFLDLDQCRINFQIYNLS